MWELIALLIYSVQWLGVVLGVGAEAVLLVGHLSALHARKPMWLANIPEVRAVQRWGLVFIVISGLGAVGYQLFNDISVLFISTFGFKWVLIALASLAFWAERWMHRGRGVLEGFAGATWLALFVVHSVAPIFVWEDLFFFYAVWTLFFLALWGGVIWTMKRGQRAVVPVAEQSIVSAEPAPAPVARPKPVAAKVAPKPVVAAAPPPPPPPPKPKVVAPPPPPPPPAPKPVMPQPVSVAVVRKVESRQVKEEVEIHEEPRPSLWQRIMSLFVRKHPAAAPAEPVHAPAVQPVVSAPAPAPVPVMANVSAPVGYKPADMRPAPAAAPKAPTPVVASAPAKPAAGLPVVEHLELMAPQAPKPAATAPVEPSYIPDYNNAPGVTIMPQKPEDVTKQNRAPIVQAA